MGRVHDLEKSQEPEKNDMEVRRQLREESVKRIWWPETQKVVGSVLSCGHGFSTGWSAHENQGSCSATGPAEGRNDSW